MENVCCETKAPTVKLDGGSDACTACGCVIEVVKLRTPEEAEAILAERMEDQSVQKLGEVVGALVLPNTTRYYISTGADHKMYTLRQTYTEKAIYRVARNCIGQSKAFYENVQRDYYIRNLSTDRDKAIAKASELVDAKLLDASIKVEDLQEIRRRNAEEMEQARAEAREKEAREQTARFDAMIADIRGAIVPFGKFKGYRFEQIAEETGYIRFWLYKHEATDEPINVVFEAFKTALRLSFPDVKPEPPSDFVDAYTGEIGQRVEFKNARVVRRFDFIRDAFGGWGQVERVYGVVFITEDGHNLTYMGTGDVSAYEVESVHTIRATVKAHEDYKGQKTTRVTRLHIVKPK